MKLTEHCRERDRFFFAMTGSDLGTSMPTESQEESISPLEADKAWQDGASPLNPVSGRLSRAS
jgi:hypothetical protein